MTNCDILVKDCRVLRQDMTVSESCSVAIGGTRICAIGPTAELIAQYRAETVLDGRGKMMTPGFIDGHVHVCQHLLRGRTNDEYPMVWTRFLVPFESRLQPEDTYISAQLSCLEMIKSGTTGFLDSGGVHMDRAVEAVIGSGMRAAIAKSTMDTGNAIVGAMKETTQEAIDHTIELYDAYNGAADGRISVYFALRQLMTCSPELVDRVKEEADRRNTGIHMHLCEHRDEVSYCLQHYQMRPTAFLADRGLLNERLVTAHNVMLSSEDIQLLTRNHVNIIHCPRSNASNHGFPKTPEILADGGIIGLGSDGASSSGMCLIDEARTLRYITQAYWGLASFDPVILTCQTLLRMLVSGGAAAIGQRDELGEVAVGKKADVILINIEQPHLYPTQNLVNTIIASACAADVTDSIIDGRLVMKNREVLTLDEEKILADARQHMDVMIRRAGYES